MKSLAWAFVRSREQRPHHDTMRAHGDGFGDVAGMTNAAIGNQRHARLMTHRGGGFDCAPLRHAHARHHASGADGARSDSHLDGICAAINECRRAVLSCHIAADDVAGCAEFFCERGDAVQHPLAVSVSGIHHEGIRSLSHQQFGALQHGALYRKGGGDAQSAMLVFVGKRMAFGLFQCLSRSSAPPMCLVC